LRVPGVVAVSKTGTIAVYAGVNQLYAIVTFGPSGGSFSNSATTIDSPDLLLKFDAELA